MQIARVMKPARESVFVSIPCTHLLSVLQEWRDEYAGADADDDGAGFDDERLCCSIMMQDDLRVRLRP